MLSSHSVDWNTTAPSFHKSPVALTLSLTMNVITDDCRRIQERVTSAPSITCCITTRSIAEANFEIAGIPEALIAIVEDSRIPAHGRSEKGVENDPGRDLAGDASIPICRAVYHEGVIAGDNSLSGMILAAQSQAASCPSHLKMLHHYEEQDIPKTRREPEEMLDHVKTRTASNKGQLVWDLVHDRTVLRVFYRNRRNLVLDSLCPNFAPHIVVTSAEESWNDIFISWQNRVDYQQTGSLTAPYHPVLPDCCPSGDEYLNHVTQAHNLQASVDIIPTLFCGPKPVFSVPVFNKQINDASIERLVLLPIVRILHKQCCKAVFFDACHVAITFRRRYDSSPDFFKAIERPYVWSDPAEPILILSQRLLGTTIIDSHSPFRVPHIIINAPPPQDLWIPWNNATTDPQDFGNGGFLIVPSPSVGIINTSMEGWEACSSADSSATGSIVDPLESWQTGIPMPETPIDEGFIVLSGDGAHDRVGGSVVDSFDYPFLNFKPISKEPSYTSDLPQSYRPIFSIEEGEDDLPPFDDWYKQ